MAKVWRSIRIPEELALRLEALAAEMMEAHIAGRAGLPNEICEAVPLRYVIEKAVDEMEGHRVRSRAPRSRKVGS